MTFRKLRNELNNSIKRDGFGEAELIKKFNIFDYIEDNMEADK